MNLSKNFTLAELTFSETAIRHGTDQGAPHSGIMANLKKLAATLERVRELTGHPIRVTSGYRSSETNKLVGSGANSAHILGLAADITCDEFGSPLQLCQLIAGSDIKFDQLIHEYKAWCHIAIGGGERRMLLTKETGSAYKLGLN